MLNFLHTWITNIAVIIIFTAFLEILLPNSDMKRYIKVIIGLLVLLVIVNPFILLNQIDITFKQDIIETSAFLDMNSSKDERTKISKYQNEKAMEIYKNNLRQQVKEIISANRDIAQKTLKIDIDVENNMESDSFGKIKSMVIEINNEKNLTVEVSKVEDININKNKKVINTVKDEYNLNDKVADEIKANLSNFFGIDKSTIKITLKK